MKKGAITKVIKEEVVGDMDAPVTSPQFMGLFKSGRLRCIIIYEDLSYAEHFIKFDKAYMVTIKKRKYHVVPKCIIRGKYPTIMWYFNNPMPIQPKYVHTQLTALSFRKEEDQNKLTAEEKELLAKVSIDSEGLDSAFNSQLLKGLYGGTGMTMKQVIIFAVIAIVIVLICLQLFTDFDIMGIFINK